VLHNREFAQKLLEPFDGFWAVRKLDGSTVKMKRNMTQMALWSHSPAIFAHGPKATVWLQWLLRKQLMLLVISHQRTEYLQ
jgi:hypothetical protein